MDQEIAALSEEKPKPERISGSMTDYQNEYRHSGYLTCFGMLFVLVLLLAGFIGISYLLFQKMGSEWNNASENEPNAFNDRALDFDKFDYENAAEWVKKVEDLHARVHAVKSMQDDAEKQRIAATNLANQISMTSLEARKTKDPQLRGAVNDCILALESTMGDILKGERQLTHTIEIEAALAKLASMKPKFPIRSWSIGQKTIQARYVSVQKSIVTLKDANGQEQQFQLHELSSRDQRYVRFQQNRDQQVSH